MAILHKISSVWKNTNKYIKQNGVWKEVFNDYHKVNNVWYPVWKYNYEVGSWSGCSASCGGGTQSRSVRCKRNDGIYKSDTFCTKSGIGKPITSQVCNTQSCIQCQVAITQQWYAPSVVITGYYEYNYHEHGGNNRGSGCRVNWNPCPAGWYRGAHIYSYESPWGDGGCTSNIWQVCYNTAG